LRIAIKNTLAAAIQTRTLNLYKRIKENTNKVEERFNISVGWSD
jgi:hypothetical protein